MILIIDLPDYILSTMNRTDGPIRVGVTTKPLDNWKSGSGHHLDELMNRVLDLNEREFGFEFTFIHYAKSANPLYGRVNELIVPRNPLTAGSIVGKRRFDIVHYTPLSVFAPLFGVKAMKTATIHGIEERLFPRGYPLYHLLHEWYVQPALMRAMDGIATVSETGKNWFIRHYGIDPNRIVVTPNAVSPEYRVLSESESSLHEIPAINRPFILHISRYSKRKNPEGVLSGFAKCLEFSGKDLQLVCAGKDWDSIEAMELAKRYGVADRVVAPGFISTETAVRLYNRAEAFVFPSWAEGFGMPNLEAMASGCPVVTSGIFAIPEIVGDAATVVERPDDHEGIGKALARLLTDDGHKKTLVDRGFKRCQAYDWESSARTLLEFWRRLAAERGLCSGR